MEITFHGGAGEVGRSCIEVDKRFLFDGGLKISEDGSEYPLIQDCSHIKAVFLSHAHLDHSGALPLLHKLGLQCGIFCTKMTRDTAKILMKDSYGIDLLNKHFTYSKDDLRAVNSFMENVVFDKAYKVDDARFRYLFAGHIPGAASVELEIDGRKILYTGDFNTSSSNLVKAAEYHLKDIDIMLCEATYGDRNHPDRIKEEDDFLQTIKETIDRGGSVLIPAFAVGRAQEIMHILSKRKFNVPIYLDGMAKKVTVLYKDRPEYINNPGKYAKATSGVHFIKKWKERQEIIKHQCIIITTSGMLDGGPVIDYLGYFYHNDKNALLLTGYQAEGTNGKMLLDEGKVFLDGNRVKVKCLVKKYDFSAHAGRSELIKFINKVRPKHLILQHGDEQGLSKLKETFKDKMDVYTPMVGDTLDL